VTGPRRDFRGGPPQAKPDGLRHLGCARRRKRRKGGKSGFRPVACSALQAALSPPRTHGLEPGVTPVPKQKKNNPPWGRGPLEERRRRGRSGGSDRGRHTTADPSSRGGVGSPEGPRPGRDGRPERPGPGFPGGPRVVAQNHPRSVEHGSRNDRRDPGHRAGHLSQVFGGWPKGAGPAL